MKVVLVEKNRTSKELAKHLEKTETTVSRWCRNEIQPSVETLFLIADFLDIDAKDLLTSFKLGLEKK